MNFKPLSEKEEQIAKDIVDTAYKVHSELGPGLLESIYEKCFCYELKKRGYNVKRQKKVPIIFDDHIFEDEELRFDVLVDDLVVCELKSREKMIPIFKAQILSYITLLKIRLGFLINFNVPLIKDGIERIIK